MPMRAIKGITPVKSNTKEDIWQASRFLVTEMCSKKSSSQRRFMHDNFFVNERFNRRVSVERRQRITFLYEKSVSVFRHSTRGR